jgi:hypothetical protein
MLSRVMWIRDCYAGSCEDRTERLGILRANDRPVIIATGADTRIQNIKAVECINFLSEVQLVCGKRLFDVAVPVTSDYHGMSNG